MNTAAGASNLKGSRRCFGTAGVRKTQSSRAGLIVYSFLVFFQSSLATDLTTMAFGNNMIACGGELQVTRYP